MKKLGAILLSGLGMLFLQSSQAQSLEELALTFSRTTPSGSARILGIGGVQNSLGGDFSSATSNPAGIGMFNRSEFTISPTLMMINNRGGYFGDTINAVRVKASIPSLSYVHHMKRDNGSWLGGTFAITLNRLNDFNSTVKYEGINPYNSIGDYFAIGSDGIDPANLNSNSLNGLAYETYFTSPIPGHPDLLYFTPVGFTIPWNDVSFERSFQSEEIRTTGKQNQWTVSYGTNFDDRFFFGASFHLRNIEYSNKKTYREQAYSFSSAAPYNPLNEFLLEENLRISGNGISGTIGAIVRPISGLQIGFSYNTPTSYYLRDSYTAYMSVDWNDFDYYGDGTEIIDRGVIEAEVTELLNEYKLTTPGKISGGATYFFKKLGFVSADVDVVDYSNGKYKPRFNGDSYDNENYRVDTLYKRAVNVRIGSEFRFKNLRVRTGFGFQDDPNAKKKNDVYSGIFSYSLGVGYRAQKFYADAALVIRTRNDSYNPYTVFGFSEEPQVSIRSFSPSLNFTVGFPF